MNVWARVLDPVGEAPHKRDLSEQLNTTAAANDGSDPSKRLRIVAPDALLGQLSPNGRRQEALDDSEITPISFDPARRGSIPPVEGFAAMWQASDHSGSLPTYEGYSTAFQENGEQSAADGALTVRHDSVSGNDANPRPFEEVYELHEELGRGAFSTVYRCRRKATGEDFAAKVIDLRPLRLRQAFKIDRLRREYEIMRRLKNPHIIRLEEVFETTDMLILVMEYCPGIELFDAIIAQRACSEKAAAIIFFQCLVALRYLHRKLIIHRDIKPENVLLVKSEAFSLNSPGELPADAPMVKLLDFGLSKTLSPNEGGSAARTFVGTPCYVAPEVEANAQGGKEEYGTKVDMWSAGALLYVMLVARFPEVDRKTYKVGMGALQRAGISDSAQDLIRRLMEPDAKKRLTAEQALEHPWLAEAATNVQVPQTSVDGVDVGDRIGDRGEVAVGRNGNDPFTATSEPPMPPAPALALQVRGGPSSAALDDIVEHMEEEPFCESAPGQLAQQQEGAIVRYNAPLGPLTDMQKKVAKCMALAHAAYANSPFVAAEVRRSAIICRTAQVESAALLRRVQQTADSVLDLIPDLELAVAESEPELAMGFFKTVRNWVQKLTDEITRVQGENKNSLMALSNAFEAVAQNNKPRLQLQDGKSAPKRKLGRLNSGREEALSIEESTPEEDGKRQDVKSQDVKSRITRLVRRLTGRQASRSSQSFMQDEQDPNGPVDNPTEDDVLDAQLEAALKAPNEQQKQLLNELSGMPEEELLDLFLSPNSTSNRMYPVVDPGVQVMNETSEENHSSTTQENPSLQTPNAVLEQSSPMKQDQEMLSNASMTTSTSANTSAVEASGVADTVRALVLRDAGPGRKEATIALQDALKHLEGVDAILHHLQNFWSSTEVIFDTLLQRSDHVERFIKFAHKPRLAKRFQERLAEYTHFWQGVRSVAVECITGHCAKAAYSFLQENSSRSNSEAAAPPQARCSEGRASEGRANRI